MRAAAIVGLLALTACDPQGVNVSAITVSPQEVQLACTGITTGYVLWEATWAPKVRKDTATKIRAGFAGISAACANPPSNAPEAMGTLLRAVQAYSKELERAAS